VFNKKFKIKLIAVSKHKVFCLFVWITTITDLDGNSYVLKLIGNYDDEFIAPKGLMNKTAFQFAA